MVTTHDAEIRKFLDELPEGLRVLPGPSDGIYWPRYKGGQLTGKRDILLQKPSSRQVYAVEVHEGDAARTIAHLTEGVRVLESGVGASAVPAAGGIYPNGGDNF